MTVIVRSRVVSIRVKRLSFRTDSMKPLGTAAGGPAVRNRLCSME